MTPPASAKERDWETLPPPAIEHSEPFGTIVKKLSVYILDAIVVPSTFEQLRTTSAGNNIRILVDHLVDNVTNPAIVNALLTLKWHFSTLEPDDRGLNETRANACEIVSWRFLTRLSGRDAVDFCLYELPSSKTSDDEEHPEARNGNNAAVTDPDEGSRLLPRNRAPDHSLPRPTTSRSTRQQLMRTVTQLGSHIFSDNEGEEDEEEEEEDPTSSFTGLNALEIAAVADAKKFLSQRLVQKIIYGIWTGDIVFWESLSVHTQKKAQFYNKRKSDPFTRLRVPRYIKTFEVLFFATFLALYYAVLVERNPYKITPLEILLYTWILAFAYDELSEYLDAGLFYYTDFWSAWDITIIGVGVAFFITRLVGLIRNEDGIVDTAFDILSLEALFLVPRICSLLSLNPYFGALIPCLKEMTKDFIKFMAVVAILYIGFFTTFTMLARDQFTLSQMSWILVKVFFGSSYIGFDVMKQISPVFGPPLMLVFVCLTNILLITSLISILSNSFTKVTAHAREEYLYIYSVYVLEAASSNRLTHFYPPLNLIPLFLIRPLRLFVSSENLRSIRILLLKATHTPIVGAIWLYEKCEDHINGANHTFGVIGPGTTNTKKVQRPFLVDRNSVRSSSQRYSKTLRPDSGSEAGFLKAFKIAAGKNGQEDLERKVEDLSAKIEELTALIMAQTQKPTPE